MMLGWKAAVDNAVSLSCDARKALQDSEFLISLTSRAITDDLRRSLAGFRRTALVQRQI